MLIGLWIAWHNYVRNPGAAARFVATFPAVYRFVSNKWYFDELYDAIFVRPALWLGRLFWKGGDVGIIDRFGPHGAAVCGGLWQSLDRTAAVRLPLQLRAGHAAGPDRRG
jgi:NADH-quinone oxidoreductase subunit L